MATEAGFKTNKGGPLTYNVVRKMLRNPVYWGGMWFHGEAMEATHEPLISKELWDQAQDAMDGNMLNTRPEIRRSEPAYRKLLSCQACGAVLTPYLRKKVKRNCCYYQCHKSVEHMRPVKEEVITAQFDEAVKRLRIDGSVISQVVAALKSSQRDVSSFREEQVTSLRAQIEKITKRLDTLYLDRLDERIDGDTYDRLSAGMRKSQAELRQKLDGHSKAEADYTDAGITLLETMRGLANLYAMQPSMNGESSWISW